MAPSVEDYSWNRVAEEAQRILEEHQSAIQEEIEGLIGDMEPFIKDDQKKCIRESMADLISATTEIQEEINEEMDALEERRVARACGYIIRLGNGLR